MWLQISLDVERVQRSGPTAHHNAAYSRDMAFNAFNERKKSEEDRCHSAPPLIVMRQGQRGEAQARHERRGDLAHLSYVVGELPPDCCCTLTAVSVMDFVAVRPPEP